MRTWGHARSPGRARAARVQPPRGSVATQTWRSAPGPGLPPARLGPPGTGGVGARAGPCRPGCGRGPQGTLPGPRGRTRTRRPTPSVRRPGCAPFPTYLGLRPGRRDPPLAASSGRGARGEKDAQVDLQGVCPQRFPSRRSREASRCRARRGAAGAKLCGELGGGGLRAAPLCHPRPRRAGLLGRWRSFSSSHLFSLTCFRSRGLP